MPARKPAKRTPKTNPAQDPPAVAEVRAIRQQMWKEAGGDINALLELAKREALPLTSNKPAPRKRKKRAA